MVRIGGGVGGSDVVRALLDWRSVSAEVIVLAAEGVGGRKKSSTLTDGRTYGGKI